MNANLLQPMPAINIWLTDAANKLSSFGIDSARLDAELILSYVLQRDRTFLHSRPEQVICSKNLKKANLYLEKRLKRIPVAYIIGQKEFYGRNFRVTPDVLIPRPESETIIDILSEILLLRQAQDFQPILKSKIQNLSPTLRLLDVGTGSGILGITAKLEFPHLSVTLTDISQKAINIATFNAKALGADVKCLISDLLANYHTKTDIILANLPYVDKKWDISPETDFEPSIALFAEDNGLLIIKRLLDQSINILSRNGLIIIESDTTQHKSLIEYAKKLSFKLVKKQGYILVFCRD